MRPSRLCLVFGLICVCPMLFGQAHSDSGDINGSVVDPTGAAIAGAKVAVTDLTRGGARNLETDTHGEYKAAALQPGAYSVRIEAPGFSTKTVASVEVRVGETLALRTDMEIGAVANDIIVDERAPVVETEKTQQAASIGTERIQGLPMNRRNYLDLALTTPGVVETNDLVDGTDFRVVQTPQSGLSFGGGNGRGNGFFIDGAENYINSGGVRPSVSQEAVQEFQVNRNGVTAEFGNASGGVINIITKSGGNGLHGDAFGFLRDSAFQARNFFDPGKSSFTRGQYGGTLGGAIRKDKTFYFLAFERLERHETSFVPIERDKTPFYNLTASQQGLVSFLESIPNPLFSNQGKALQQALTPANNPFVLSLFNANSGTFPFAETNNQGSLRIDHRFSDKDFLFFRANTTQGDDQNSALGALIGYSRGRSVDVLDGTLMLSNTHIFSPSLIAETRLMWGYLGLKVIPNDPNGPQIDVEGYGSFGREIFLPSSTFERHYQLIQNFNYTSGKHAIKFGVDIDPVRDTVVSDTFFGGRFQFGPGIQLGQLINANAGSDNASVVPGQILTASGRPDLVSALSQSITSLQAFALGVPLYYQQGFGNPNWIGTSGRYSLFAQDSWRTLGNRLTLNYGLRYEMEANPTPVRSQFANFGPRFGFALSPFADNKTVIRGGFGLFYARIDAQEANLPATLNGVQIAQVFVTALGQPSVTNPQTGLPVTSADIWGTLLKQGVIGTRTISENDIAQFGLAPGPNSPDRVIFGIDKNIRDPYSEQASFEIEHAFGDVAVSASYEFNHTLHLVRTLDENLYYTGRTTDGQPTFGFYNPEILQNNVVQSTAQSWYNALILQVNKRYASHLNLNAHYTFSNAEDESTDFNSDFEPNDQLNARAEKALSSFDQRHRFVATAMIDSALASGGAHSLRQNAFGNWVISPIFVASSGRPFNILTGFDSFGDNHDTTHRPFGFGRNVGHGPDYISGDMRLSRKFPFGGEGRRNVEFIAEGFNLENRTNFRTLNNVAGTANPALVPRPLSGHTGSPLQPFAFTSAYDPRQFQFALRVSF